MGTSINVKVLGTWKTATKAYQKVNGEWKTITSMSPKINGEYKVVPFHIHDYSYLFEDIEATCFLGGYTKCFCSCGEWVMANMTEALGHNFSGKAIQSNPYRGNHYYLCSRCSTVKSEGCEIYTSNIDGLQYCTQCGLVSSDTSCQHFSSTLTWHNTNANYHYATCSCGAEYLYYHGNGNDSSGLCPYC